MKLFALVFATSLLTVGASVFAEGSLSSANSQDCRDVGYGLVIDCADDAYFYFGHDGRCGCLSDDEVLSMTACNARHYRCNRGETFSRLYPTRNMAQQLGCGCYETYTER